jgi:hypothetical protein
MPTMLTGGRNTENILQDRRIFDFSKKIWLLEPDAAPLTVLLAKTSKVSTSDPDFKWFEDELDPRTDLINDATPPSDTDTTWTVDNGSYFRAGDIVKVPRTGETVRVTAVATNDLTVVRSIGAVAGAALLDNDPIYIIGNANQEFATSRTLKSTLEVTKQNYAQIFRTPVGSSATQEATELRGGNDLAYQRRKKGIEHTVDIERAFLFGEKSEDTSGSHPLRTTGGLLEFITTNITDASGALSETEWETWLRSIFRYGNKSKLVIASPLVMSVISAFAQGRLQSVPEDKTHGVAITRWLSPHGEVNLAKSNLLEGTIYGGYAFGVDMEFVSYRPLRETQLKTNIQANDEDGQKDEYITECGLQVKLEKAHGILKGVTS